MTLLASVLKIAAVLLGIFILYGAACFFSEQGIFHYVAIAVVVIGLGLVFVQKSPAIPRHQPDDSSFSIASEASAPAPAEATQALPSGGYLSGSWANKFNRNGTSSRSFELDSTLYDCGGFTLEYEVMEVTQGKLKSGSQFKAFVRTSDGEWVSVKTFKLKDKKATVDIRFDKAMDVESVAVVCYQEGNFSYSYVLGIRDAV